MVISDLVTLSLEIILNFPITFFDLEYIVNLR